MAPKRLLLKPGQLFRVPLGDVAAHGVLARVKGPLCLGYFFLGKSPHDCLAPDRADFVGIIGTLGLRSGRWEIVGELKGFTTSAWPVPQFLHRDVVSGAAEVRRYDEALHFLTAVPAATDLAKFPLDGTWGDVAVERMLKRIRSGPVTVESASSQVGREGST